MPKLSRSVFTQTVDDLWQVVQQNFAKHHRVHGHIVAVDAMGRQRYFMQGPAGHPQLLARDIVPVPGSWQDHLDLLGAEFAAHKTVAAIIVEEAWYRAVTIGPDSTTTTAEAMATLPSASPDRQELVFVAGFWPREYVAIGHKATIDRTGPGQPRLVDHEPLTSERTTMLVSWFDEILPQPHN